MDLELDELSATTLLVEEDLVVVRVKGVLPPSEEAPADVAQTILERFDKVLAGAGSSPSIKEQVSGALKREVVDVRTALSPITGSLVAMFLLGRKEG
jgi:hypothetical protein